jgi:IS1 family transposase
MTTEKLIKRLLRLQGGCIHASEDTDNWSMHDSLVANARTIGIAIASIKTLQAENEQLRARLVRQACYFEHIEAREQPKTWPLLEDEGSL